MEVIRVENISKLNDLSQVGTGIVSKDLNRWWACVRGKEDPYARVGHERPYEESQQRRQRVGAERH